MGVLECRNPTLAAHQFMGILNEFSLWPWMMGRESLPVSAEEIVDETVRMFLEHYRNSCLTQGVPQQRANVSP